MSRTITCPKCGKPMEKGHLFSSTIQTGIYWMPGNERPYYHGVKMFLSDIKDKGGDRITGEYPDEKWKLSGYSADAYYCRECRCGFFEAK